MSLDPAWVLVACVGGFLLAARVLSWAFGDFADDDWHFESNPVLRQAQDERVGGGVESPAKEVEAPTG